jgi:hypothetical protein
MLRARNMAIERFSVRVMFRVKVRLEQVLGLWLGEDYGKG